MIEMALVFDKYGKPMHWHEPPGSSGVSIPDSRELWDILWASRVRLGGVAHTHPLSMLAAPSPEDVTTFRAIEDGLGRLLVWPIVTPSETRYWIRNIDDHYCPADLLGAMPLMNSAERKAWIETTFELRNKSFKGEEDG